MNKNILSIGIVTYLILGIMALYLYQERTAFLDISFHLFYILKDGDFAIQNNRFGAVVTQVFPLLGSKLGLSLSAIMKWYSVGFVLYYFTIFFLCAKVLKSPKFGLAMLLFSTLMVTDTFYWIQSEFPQGIALLIFYFALLYKSVEYDGNQLWIVHFLLALLNITLVFFHPLLVFPYFFCLLYLYLKNRGVKNRLLNLSLFKSVVLFLSVWYFKSKYFKTNYESHSMEGIYNFITFYPNYLGLESNSKFLEYLIWDYHFLLLFFGVVVFIYLKNRKLVLLGLFLSFFLGYLLLVNVCYPEGGEQFYMENLYLPLSIFVIIPLVFEISYEKNKRYYFPFLILLFSIRLLQIGYNSQFYSDRITYLNSYLEETNNWPQKKIVASEKHYPKEELGMIWASPYEFWLLSTVNSGETRSILITNNVEKTKKHQSFNQKFITKWGAFDYSILPEKYFLMRDTTYYQFIE